MKKIALSIAILLISLVSFANEGDTLKINFFTKYDLQQWKGSWLHKKFDYIDPSKSYKRAYLVIELGCASYGCCVWDYGFHAYIGKPLAGYDTLKFPQKDTVVWNSKMTILDSLWITRKSQNIEVARLITPYGTYMRAGSNGFTNNWTHPYVFDVTDYLPLLKDSFGLVIESGGYDGKKGFNLTSNLILIEGGGNNLPKQVIKAYKNGFSFKNEAQIDTVIKPYKFKLGASEKQVKFRSIVTGHNQDGEFSPIEYYVKLNGTEVFSKRLWKTDCDKTHVQPQGGTWIFSRCNWCPGEKITDFEIDLTPYLKMNDSNELWVSFRNIETSSTNIQATYDVVGNIITYGKMDSFDMSVEDIIAPSLDKTYFLDNSLCQGPKIKIKNSGYKPVKEAYIDYWVDPNNKTTHIWKGNLMPEQTEVVDLPAFPWNGVDFTNPKFYISLQRHIYNLIAWNDTMTSVFAIPPTYSTNLLKFEIRTTNDTKENKLNLYDELGANIFSKTYLNDGKLYSDTITLENGCYRAELIDFDDRLEVGDGLSFWWSTQQLSKSSGSFRILNGTNNNVLKTFNADFGGKINHQFTVNNKKIGEYVHKSSYNYREYVFPKDTIHTSVHSSSNLPWNVYPNPVKRQDKLTLDFEGNQLSSIHISIYTINGKLVLEKEYTSRLSKLELDLSKLSKGQYFLHLDSGDFKGKKFIEIH